MGTSLKTTDEILASIYRELGSVKKELRATQFNFAGATRRIAKLERTVRDQAVVIEKRDRTIAGLHQEITGLRTELKVERQLTAGLRGSIDKMTEDHRVAELNRLSDTSSTSASQADQRPRYPAKQLGSGKIGRPVGGSGQAPTWNDSPDIVVVELRPERCSNGHHLSGAVGTLKESRQVTDINVSTTTTEYHQICVICPTCQVKTVEPFVEARARVSYGPGLRALSLFLTQQSRLPIDATAAVLGAFGAPVSRSCVARWNSDAAKVLITSGFMNDLRTALLESPWIGGDESPLHIATSEKLGLVYVHGATSDKLTYLHSGTRSLADSVSGGIIGHYDGVVVSDCAPMYFAPDARIQSHQRCVAHVIRELNMVHEAYLPQGKNPEPHPQPWAGELAARLSEWVHDRPPVDQVRPVLLGLAHQGLVGPKPTKQSYRREKDAWNLATRLTVAADDYLLFLTPAGRTMNLPPTNNYAEQSFKPLKVAQRRSGPFRSLAGLNANLTLQSYLRSAKASGTETLEAIKMLILGEPWRPALAI